MTDSAHLFDVTPDTFGEKVLQSDVPVLVDFWATWCGPCRQIAPVLEEMADELDGSVKIAKLDVDNAQELAAQYHVQEFPRSSCSRMARRSIRSEAQCPNHDWLTLFKSTCLQESRLLPSGLRGCSIVTLGLAADLAGVVA